MMSTKPGLPPEFLCKICTNLIKNAVMMPCCAGPCCDTCAVTGVTCFGTCPLCQAVTSSEDLIPFRMLRDKIDKYNEKMSRNKPTTSESPPRPKIPDSCPPSARNIVSVLSTNTRSPSSSSLSSYHSPRSWTSPATRSPGSWSGMSVPPPVYPPRLHPENDTLAQFENAMRNIDAQKRARQVVTKTLRSKAYVNKDYTITCLNGVLSIKEKSPQPEVKAPGPITKDIEGLDAVSEEELTDGEEGAKEGLEKSPNDCDEKEMNSKHLLKSGQIIQDPQTLAEIKMSRSNSLEDSSKTSPEDTQTALQKALSNMKKYDEDRIKEMRKTLEKITDKEQRKRKKEKKKRKKEKAEKKLKKLLKETNLDIQDLEMLLKTRKKKSSKKNSNEAKSHDVNESKMKKDLYESHRLVKERKGNIQINVVQHVSNRRDPSTDRDSRRDKDEISRVDVSRSHHRNEERNPCSRGDDHRVDPRDDHHRPRRGFESKAVSYPHHPFHHRDRSYKHKTWSSRSSRDKHDYYRRR